MGPRWCSTEILRFTQDDWLGECRAFRTSAAIVTAATDGTIHLWDAVTGDDLFGPLRHTKGVRTVQFSPDGMRLAAGGSDGTLRIWETADGLLLFSLLGRSGSEPTSLVIEAQAVFELRAVAGIDRFIA